MFTSQALFRECTAWLKATASSKHFRPLAGRPTADADLTAVNLASLLNDEDHWHIPTIGDSSPADIKTSANASTIASNPKINMNSADVKLLETLPSIGEIRTKAMIGHRDANGPFPTMDDLLAVNGIGAATLESIRSIIEAR